MHWWYIWLYNSSRQFVYKYKILWNLGLLYARFRMHWLKVFAWDFYRWVSKFPNYAGDFVKSFSSRLSINMHTSFIVLNFSFSTTTPTVMITILNLNLHFTYPGNYSWSENSIRFVDFIKDWVNVRASFVHFLFLLIFAAMAFSLLLKKYLYSTMEVMLNSAFCNSSKWDSLCYNYLYISVPQSYFQLQFSCALYSLPS